MLSSPDTREGPFSSLQILASVDGEMSVPLRGLRETGSGPTVLREREICQVTVSTNSRGLISFFFSHSFVNSIYTSTVYSFWSHFKLRRVLGHLAPGVLLEDAPPRPCVSPHKSAWDPLTLSMPPAELPLLLQFAPSSAVPTAVDGISTRPRGPGSFVSPLLTQITNFVSLWTVLPPPPKHLPALPRSSSSQPPAAFRPLHHVPALLPAGPPNCFPASRLSNFYPCFSCCQRLHF